MRGNDVRIVEERQNQALVHTLRAAGPAPSRHFYEEFRDFQYHTYEPRTGAKLLEWVTREVALIDAAVAVDGVGDELCRWIGNVTREGLIRAFLTFDPQNLTEQRAAELDIALYDLVLAPSPPVADLSWRPIPVTIALQDQQKGLSDDLSTDVIDTAIDPVAAAEGFERVLTGR